jgi:flagellar L-ring protein FlgH
MVLIVIFTESLLTPLPLHLQELFGMKPYSGYLDLSQNKMGRGILAWGFAFAIVLFPLAAQAESLFQASATKTTQQPMVPRSLFVRPRPQYVGDMVTIRINDVTRQQTQMDYNVESERTLNENGSQILNGVVGSVLNKLPVTNSLLGKATHLLQIPSIDGINNTDSMQSRANITRVNRMEQQVTCQIVEVLPNGHLLVQGRKSMLFAKEKTDLFVTGIVNPFYIDMQNTVDSNLVGNLQFAMGGNGVLTRTQNDGVLTKLYQYLK